MGGCCEKQKRESGRGKVKSEPRKHETVKFLTKSHRNSNSGDSESKTDPIDRSNTGGDSKQSDSKPVVDPPEMLIKLAQTSGVLNMNKMNLFRMPYEAEFLSPTLRSLELANNKLTEISEPLPTFPNLKRLILEGNKLESLPKDMKKFEFLEILDLSCNKISDLPESFGELKYLKKLLMHRNRLNEFPVVVCHLRKLEMLNLSNNIIQHWGDEEEIDELSVTELNLNGNKLGELPVELAQCQKLHILRLKDNCLTLEEFKKSDILKSSNVALLDYENNAFHLQDFRYLDGFQEYQQRHAQLIKKMY